ncbi:MAG: ABC transporter permease [Patescibacteria group bacterium]|nr:ABC transporter permease [Patescibacteria group bacterium]MCL5431584.1 ABC transporter permease [Patescibacteria group bacterium]
MTKEIVIKPNGSFLDVDLREIWRYRELFYIFAWRDIKLRYKQTVLGIIWVLFQPLVSTGIFSIFFGKIAKIPSDNLPYPLFVLAGLVIWNFFSSALSASSQSLIGNEGIIKKVYFPRLILPISSVVTAGVDFFITFLVLLVAVVYFGYLPSLLILPVLPVLLIITILMASGLGMFMASLNVKYRDVRFILPFFIQIGLFVTPVIYPLSIIYDWRKWFLIINPLTGVIETLRALIVGRAQPDFSLLIIGLIVSIPVFCFGLFYFRRTEAYFADIA